MTTWKRLVATVIALLAPLAVLVSYLALRRDVPDPLPVHWNVHGEVDNTASLGGFFVATLVISLVLALVATAALWWAHSPMAGRGLACLLTFGAWVAAATTVATFLAARGAAAAADVTMPWYVIAAIVVVPLALGAAVWGLLPAHWQHASAPPPSARTSLEFAPGEQVVWVGHAHSSIMRTASWVAAVVGVVVLFFEVSAAIPVLIIAVASGMVCELGVRIDARGVHTLWGPFGWPRPRIALADIVSAAAEQINPLQWGGWGYRISSRGVAAVIRRGPGLVIARAGKSTYAVTVDGADHGAEVLNALLARDERLQP
jgi:hypothetical protein